MPKRSYAMQAPKRRGVDSAESGAATTVAIWVRRLGAMWGKYAAVVLWKMSRMPLRRLVNDC
jgi:hypothetical protein